MNGSDHMAWQLKLDELTAESNLYANEVARKSAEADEALERWKLLQDEIQLHMASAKGDRS